MTLIAGYVFSSLMINLLVIYGMGQDISLAARYHFVYFPGLILLVAVALAPCWQQDLISGNKLIGRISAADSRVVIVLLAMGLVGSFTVITNLGFQKSLASDHLAAHIQEFSTLPTVVAMTQETHSEIRELVALALSFERLNVDKAQIPQFILVQQDRTGVDLATSNFAQILKAQTKPLNLFGINLDLDDEKLKQLGCIRDEAIDLSKSGYRDRFYLCQP
jgi:hypothetical protein